MHPGSLRSELRATLALAAPAVAQSLLQTLVFLADRFFLGRFSADALAAMQIAGPLTWTLQSVFGAFATGTLALVGRAVGARDPALAGSALRASVGIAVLLGAAVGLAGTLGLHALVGALAGAASSPVREAAIGYLGVVLPAMPVLFVAMVCTTALQASGDTRTPLAIALVTNAVNLGLNGLLIFGNLGCPRLGARGAAIANVTALSVEMLLGLAALADVRRPASLRGAPWTGTVAALRRLAAVSTGAFAERAIYHAGYLVFVRITNGLGAAPMAAHQALLSMESVSFLSADGFGVAAGARAAQRLGAGDAVGARRAGWIATGASTAIVGVVAMALWAGAPFVLAATLTSPTAVRAGLDAMLPCALAQVPMAASIVLLQSLRGAGATREAFAIALAGSFVVRIAATWACVDVLHLGLAGVWFGSGADWLVRMLLAVWRWRRGRWSRTRV